jgi:hypothetical protein
MAELAPCTTTVAHIDALVDKGFLPLQEVSHWWLPPRGCTVPELAAEKVVVFASFFEHGLGLPVHPFLRGLLYHYGI